MQTIATARPPINGERGFFLLLAGSMFAAVLTGFAPSYYLRAVMMPPAGLQPPSPLVHLHGLVFSAWIALFMAQVAFIATGRRDLHRAMGVAGLVLVLVMIPLGVATALAQVARRSGPATLDPHVWLAMPLASVLGFGVLFLLALALRRRPATHKRLMVLGMAAMLSAAFGRIVFIPPFLGLLVIPNLYALALAGWDVTSLRRVHPATLWGGLLVLVTTVGPIFFWGSSAWLALAHAIA
jgi:hypothetical protein